MWHWYVAVRKEERPFTQILLFLLVIWLSEPCYSAVKSHEPVVLREVNEFVLALLGRDEEHVVKEYLRSSPTFSVDGKFTRNISNFLYEQDAGSGKKSILDFVSKVNFRTKLIWQSNRVFTLIITSEEHYGQLNELSFLQNQWMKKYLACEFVLVEERIELFQSVCFAETGGPFSPDYEM